VTSRNYAWRRRIALYGDILGGGTSPTIQLSDNSQAENTSIGTTIGTLTVSNPSGVYTFSKTVDADAAFTLTGATLKNAIIFNYEVATFHLVTISANNGVDTPLTRIFSILVTDVNEAPVISSNGGGATAAVSVAENTTAVTTVTATDVDAGTVFTYSISGGADASKFTIGSSSGILSFVTAPDFETPTDADTNNDYIVIVQVSDGALTDTQTITVSVTNANEAPVITSNGGGTTASISVNENTTAVTTVTATDVDAGATLTYSISGGADSGKFSIGSSSGILTFAVAPNFEVPTDADTDNVYVVTVQVSDGSLTDTQTISVTVLDVSESSEVLPHFTLMFV
jgi:serralysin